MSGTSAEVLQSISLGAGATPARSARELREWIAFECPDDELARIVQEAVHCAGFLWPVLDRPYIVTAPPPITVRASIGLTEWSQVMWCRRARLIGIPRRAWLADDGEESPAWRAITRWFAMGRGRPSLLTLLGRAGCGKTFAASRALKLLHERYGFPASDLVFIHTPELCRQLMNPELRDDAFERAVETRFAVLDDLGAPYVKHDSFLESLLEDVVVIRESERRPTICSANWTSAQLETALGFRVADRLLGGLVEELPGRSYRRRQAGRRG